MRTPRTKFTKGSGTHDVQIGSRRLNISVALVVYRCEVCHGELKRRDNGLVCKASPEHRGFIHKDQLKQADKVKDSLAEIEEQIWKTH